MKVPRQLAALIINPCFQALHSIFWLCHSAGCIRGSS